MWTLIGMIVVGGTLGGVLSKCLDRVDARRAQEAKDKEERERASGKWPYNYVAYKSKRGDKR